MIWCDALGHHGGAGHRRHVDGTAFVDMGVSRERVLAVQSEGPCAIVRVVQVSAPAERKERPMQYR